MDKEKKEYTISEVAEKLGVSRQTVYLYQYHGYFPNAFKLRGTRWRIPKKDIDNFDSEKVDLSDLYSKKERPPFVIVNKTEQGNAWVVITSDEQCPIAYESDESTANELCELINMCADNWRKS